MYTLKNCKIRLNYERKAVRATVGKIYTPRLPRLAKVLCNDEYLDDVENYNQIFHESDDTNDYEGLQNNLSESDAPEKVEETTREKALRKMGIAAQSDDLDSEAKIVNKMIDDFASENLRTLLYLLINAKEALQLGNDKSYNIACSKISDHLLNAYKPYGTQDYGVGLATLICGGNLMIDSDKVIQKLERVKKLSREAMGYVELILESQSAYLPQRVFNQHNELVFSTHPLAFINLFIDKNDVESRNIKGFLKVMSIIHNLFLFNPEGSDRLTNAASLDAKFGNSENTKGSTVAVVTDENDYLDNIVVFGKQKTPQEQVPVGFDVFDLPLNCKEISETDMEGIKKAKAKLVQKQEETTQQTLKETSTQKVSTDLLRAAEGEITEKGVKRWVNVEITPEMGQFYEKGLSDLKAMACQDVVTKFFINKEYEQGRTGYDLEFARNLVTFLIGKSYNNEKAIVTTRQKDKVMYDFTTNFQLGKDSYTEEDYLIPMGGQLQSKGYVILEKGTQNKIYAPLRLVVLYMWFKLHDGVKYNILDCDTCPTSAVLGKFFDVLSKGKYSMNKEGHNGVVWHSNYSNTQLYIKSFFVATGLGEKAGRKNRSVNKEKGTVTIGNDDFKKDTRTKMQKLLDANFVQVAWDYLGMPDITISYNCELENSNKKTYAFHRAQYVLNTCNILAKSGKNVTGTWFNKETGNTNFTFSKEGKALRVGLVYDDTVPPCTIRHNTPNLEAIIAALKNEAVNFGTVQPVNEEAIITLLLNKKAAPVRYKIWDNATKAYSITPQIKEQKSRRNQLEILCNLAAYMISEADEVSKLEKEIEALKNVSTTDGDSAKKHQKELAHLQDRLTYLQKIS